MPYKVPPSGQFFQCVFGAFIGRYLLLSPVAIAAASIWNVSDWLGHSLWAKSG